MTPISETLDHIQQDIKTPAPTFTPQCGQCNFFDSRGVWGYCSKRTVIEFWDTGAMTVNETRPASAEACPRYQEFIPF